MLQNDRFDNADVRFYKPEHLKHHLNPHLNRKKTGCQDYRIFSDFSLKYCH
jgi:hypothetical protein